MACFNSCRHNCFGPYYPCPIWICNASCSNNVVNPPVNVPNWAFFSLNILTEVAGDSVIPITIVSSSGTEITSSAEGTINLTAGTYRVTYSINSILGENGTNVFGLNLNSSTLSQSVETVSGTPGDRVSTSNNFVFSVTGNATLNLVNLGAEAVDVELVNLTIYKIN